MSNTSSLLINESPLQVLPTLAELLGLNEALILQQIQYFVEVNKKHNKCFKDGYHWTYGSIQQWKEQNFPFWSEKTIQRAFTHLEKTSKVLISANYNNKKFDRTKWYRIDYEMLNMLMNSQKDKMTATVGQNDRFRIGQNDLTNTLDLNTELKNIDIMTFSSEKSVYIFSLIFSFYSKTYLMKLGKQHPPLTKKQLKKIVNNIAEFINIKFQDEYTGNNTQDLIDSLEYMILNFFDTVKDTDYNISHFATPGILENRYYKAVYNG